MNFIERAIATVSPAWAARREYYRSLLVLSRYEAGKIGRRNDGWTTAGTSANAEIGMDAARIRWRARDLVRNNPWAAQAVRKLANKIVGTGIVPRLATPPGEIELKRGAADNWNAFSENCDPEGQLDFYGLQALAARTLVEAGEALVRFIPRPSSWKLRVPLQLQILEPDFLDSSKTLPLAGGGAIIQGVEYDAEGRRAAYWLFDSHPGDSLLTSGNFVPGGAMPGLRGGLTSRRVPASEVLHIFDPLRPGQARGVSMFTPAALKLRDIDDIAEAKLYQQKIAACFAAFVKRAGNVTSPLAGKAATTDAKGRRLETLSPGMIQYLGLDEEIQFATPPAAEGYLEQMTMELHAAAAGIGMTYEMLTGDLSGTNYSSIRAGMIDFLDLLDHLQWRILIHQMCRPVGNRVSGLLVATGRRDPGLAYPMVWTPPRRRLLDPQKEVAAIKESARIGLEPMPAAIAAQGDDADETLAMIKDWNAKLDADGIILDSDPRKVAAPNAAQPQSNPPQDEPPAPGTKRGKK